MKWTEKMTMVDSPSPPLPPEENRKRNIEFITLLFPIV